jgi:hypothetical protein
MRQLPVIILVLTSYLTALSKGRNYSLDSSLLNAKYVGEVKIIEYKYDTTGLSKHYHFKTYIVSVTFSPLTNLDSIFTVQVPFGAKRKETLEKNSIRKNYCGSFLWKQPGQNVLLVLDKFGKIDLFADILPDKYLFWTPWWMGSVNFFFLNPPAEKTINNKYRGKLNKLADDYAKENGFTFGSAWSCYIKKSDLKLYRKAS